MKGLYTGTLLLLWLGSLHGQTPDYTFSGEFDRVPFESFAETMEAELGVRFFFRGDDTRIAFCCWKLAEVLEENLEPHGLSSRLDAGGNVFVVPHRLTTLDEVIKGSEAPEEAGEAR